MYILESRHPCAIREANAVINHIIANTGIVHINGVTILAAFGKAAIVDDETNDAFKLELFDGEDKRVEITFDPDQQKLVVETQYGIAHQKLNEALISVSERR